MRYTWNIIPAFPSLKENQNAPHVTISNIIIIKNNKYIWRDLHSQSQVHKTCAFLLSYRCLSICIVLFYMVVFNTSTLLLQLEMMTLKTGVLATHETLCLYWKDLIKRSVTRYAQTKCNVSYLNVIRIVIILTQVTNQARIHSRTLIDITNRLKRKTILKLILRFLTMNTICKQKENAVCSWINPWTKNHLVINLGILKI